MKPNVHALSGKTILSLLLIAFIFLGLILAIKLSGQRQDVRPKAASNGTSLSVFLTPVNSTGIAPGGSVDFQINLKNVSTASQSVIGSDVVMTFTPNDSLSISSLACGTSSPLANKGMGMITGNKIELVCFKDAGTPAYIMQPNEQISIGSFHAIIGATAANGTTITLSFTSSDIPVPGTQTNLANLGVGASIVVGQIATPTPTMIIPTLTPIAGCNCGGLTCGSSCVFQKVTDPNITYTDPFKCAPTNSSATGTLKDAFCQRQLRGKGDADGSGKVNLVDYDYYRRAALLDSGIPANINADFSGDGEMSTTDGMIVLESLGVVGSSSVGAYPTP